jgi:hypothetical protein
MAQTSAEDGNFLVSLAPTEPNTGVIFEDIVRCTPIHTACQVRLILSLPEDSCCNHPRRLKRLSKERFNLPTGIQEGLAALASYFNLAYSSLPGEYLRADLSAAFHSNCELLHNCHPASAI